MLRQHNTQSWLWVFQRHTVARLTAKHFIAHNATCHRVFSTHVQSLLFMSPTVLQNHNLHSNILQFSVDVQNLQLRSWISLVVTSWVGCLTDCIFNCMVFLLVGLRLLKTCLMVKNVVQRRQSFFDLFGIQTLLLQVCL